MHNTIRFISEVGGSSVADGVYKKTHIPNFERCMWWECVKMSLLINVSLEKFDLLYSDHKNS